MKSIMEEASSILKAIEKGWNRAGKPQEFTVKIFEEPEHNFLGMTTKSAKIGFFFKEDIAGQKQQRGRYAAGQKRLHGAADRSTGRAPTRRAQQKPQPTQQQARQPERKRWEHPNEGQAIAWSDEMVSFVTTWVKKSLILLNLPNITFTTTIDGTQLRLQFDTTVVDQSSQEKVLFRSFAYLLLQSLRNEFKESLRGLKVVLTSQ